MPASADLSREDTRELEELLVRLGLDPGFNPDFTTLAAQLRHERRDTALEQGTQDRFIWRTAHRPILPVTVAICSFIAQDRHSEARRRPVLRFGGIHVPLKSLREARMENPD